MDEKRDAVKYDLEGYAALTEAVRALLDRFPGMEQGERMAFATLRAEGGLALFPGDGAVVEQEKRSVTGRVRQVCRYPFVVLIRRGGLTEQARSQTKEWLDALGRWLCRQPVTVADEIVRLEDYPPLTDGRKFLDFSIQAPAYLYERDEHQAETWAVEMAARYENIFTI